MMIKHLKIGSLFCMLLTIVGLHPIAAHGTTPAEVEDRHISVTMRMIGHEVLLSLGDSSSRVLPIAKIDDRYRIEFESDFQFEPTDLVATISRVMQETNMTHGYLVEVEKSDTKEIVYSFEVRQSTKRDLIPCAGRIQPKDRYSLLISVLDSSQALMSAPGEGNDNAVKEDATYYKPVLLTIPFLFLLGFIGYYRKKKSAIKIDPHKIQMGETQFDKRKMELSFDHTTIELTSKEADLLYLLHTSANAPLDRELILQRVWGDGGDYVGRTLDVFISKLRKKLEADSSLKIVNIRGVGYKLMIDDVT